MIDDFVREAATSVKACLLLSSVLGGQVRCLYGPVTALTVQACAAHLACFVDLPRYSNIMR